MKRPFIKGLDLSEHLYGKAVKPLLAKTFPGLSYSAALIGPGSEVLGFDTPQSTDHDWGPRLQIFLSPRACESHRKTIDDVLCRQLPDTIDGYPTRFTRHEDGTKAMGEGSGCPLTHGIKILTVSAFFEDCLGFDPTGEIRPVDWLSVPEHHLLMVTAGRVFHDGLGQLEPLREKLRYYPRDVWLYLLAAQWRRVAQEEAFMARCGQAGDDLGSRLLAARQVRDLMRLCFLMERRYTPYMKWLGTAFARLSCAGRLLPVFTSALAAGSWEERQRHLVAAWESVAKMHNSLGITKHLATKVSPYYNRPFLVIHGDRFAEAIREAIDSEEVRALPAHLGAVDQFVDSTDALKHLEQLRGVWGGTHGSRTTCGD